MKQPVMECPSCKEIEFEHIDTLTAAGEKDVLEYRCSSCGEYQTFTGRNYVPVHLRNQAE